MGLFVGDKKVQIAVTIAKLEAQVEHLTQENEFLRGSVSKLQEALYARESPVAYERMKQDEAAVAWDAAHPPPSPEEKAKRQRKIEITEQYLAEYEKDSWFADGDEMISALTQVIGAPEPESVHENEES